MAPPPFPSESTCTDTLLANEASGVVGIPLRWRDGESRHPATPSASEPTRQPDRRRIDMTTETLVMAGVLVIPFLLNAVLQVRLAFRRVA